MKNKKTKSRIEKVTKKMSFSELIDKYPDSIEVLLDSGMHCFGCAMASFETIEQGCIAHGLNPDEIVAKINKKLGEKKK